MNNASEKSSHAKEQINEKIRKSADVAQSAVDKVNEKAEEIENQFEEYADTLRKYVKKCPIKSVLAASAAGFVLGLLMKK